MSKVLIHFFSGTGNTSDMVQKVSEGLEKSGNQCTMHGMDQPMTQAFRESILSYDLHLFCFPIYATAVPHLVRLYIKRLPKVEQVHGVILTTNGRISTKCRDGYQGWALHQGRLYLMRKGFDVFYSETLDYPHNVTIAGPPRNNKYNRIIIQMAESKLQSVILDIDKLIRCHRKIFLLNFVWSVPFGILYDFMGRRAIGKLFAADTNCTSCGQCQVQ